jgi:hypothetical protein
MTTGKATREWKKFIISFINSGGIPLSCILP